LMSSWPISLSWGFLSCLWSRGQGSPRKVGVPYEWQGDGALVDDFGKGIVVLIVMIVIGIIAQYLINYGGPSDE